MRGDYLREREWEEGGAGRGGEGVRGGAGEAA